MLGFLARLVGGKALFWVIGSGVIMVTLAAAITGLINYGIALRAAKVADDIIERKQQVQSTNFKIDRETIDRDSALKIQLQEIDRKWSSQNPNHVPLQ